MTATLGPINRTGPEGPQGEQGPPGLNGDDGLDGSQWFTGNSDPTFELGSVNDYFLNKKTGDFFKKTEIKWVYQGNLKGPKGDKGEPGLNGLVQTFNYTFTAKGIYAETYGEKIVLASDTDTIVQYTVPINKRFDLIQVLSSGENIAKYTVLVNGNILAKYRTYFTHFDRELPLGRHTCYAGDVVTLVVENFRNADAEFNATIIGDLYAD